MLLSYDLDRSIATILFIADPMVFLSAFKYFAINFFNLHVEVPSNSYDHR